MSIGKRIKHIRKHIMKMSQSDFSKAVGVSQGTLSDLEKDKGNPSVDTVISVSGYSGISTDWILLGKDHDSIATFPELKQLLNIYSDLTVDDRKTLEKYARFLLSQNLPSKTYLYIADQKSSYSTGPPEEKKVYLPVLGTAAAGMPIMAEEILEGFLPVPATMVKKNTYIVRAKGDSMVDAGINDGDLILVNPQPAVDNGEIALIKVDGDVTIKRFFKSNKEIKLRPANSNMKDIKITDFTKVKVLGKVIKVIPAEEAATSLQYEFNGPNE